MSYERYTEGDTSVITAYEEKVELEHPELDRIRQERAAAYSKADARDAAAKDGFVYVITMPDIPGWVKIGHARDPYQRVKQVMAFFPTEPEVHYMRFVQDRAAAEKWVHNKLARFRIQRSTQSGKQRELFQVTPDVARKVIDEYNDTRMGHRSGWTTTGTDNGLAIDRRGGD